MSYQKEKTKPNFVIITAVLLTAMFLGTISGAALSFIGRWGRSQIAADANSNKPVGEKTPQNTPKPAADEMIDLTNPGEAAKLGEGVSISTKSPYSDKANPLMLLVQVDNQGNLKLNNEDIGNISAPQGLIMAFREIFKSRELSKMMDNSVFVVTPSKIKKSILTDLIQALKDAGAQKIALYPKN